MKALLLSAGLGNRLKPFTDNHPKALAPVNGRSLLECNIRNLQRFGIYDIVVNVHHFAGQITDLLQKEQGFGSRIEISDETDEVLETGGGLRKASAFLDSGEDFLVMNVDILTNADLDRLIGTHRASGALATLAVQQRISSRYFLFDEQQLLRGWENVRTGDCIIPGGEPRNRLQQRAFSGIQVLAPEIFSLIERQGKFSLVDLYLDLCGRRQLIAWDHTGDLLLDVGKPESLAKAASLFGGI